MLRKVTNTVVKYETKIVDSYKIMMKKASVWQDRKVQKRKDGFQLLL